MAFCVLNDSFKSVQQWNERRWFDILFNKSSSRRGAKLRQEKQQQPRMKKAFNMNNCWRGFQSFSLSCKFSLFSRLVYTKNIFNFTLNLIRLTRFWFLNQLFIAPYEEECGSSCWCAEKRGWRSSGIGEAVLFEARGIGSRRFLWCITPTKKASKWSLKCCTKPFSSAVKSLLQIIKRIFYEIAEEERRKLCTSAKCQCQQIN